MEITYTEKNVRKIFTILGALGYKFHGKDNFTYDQVVAEWGSHWRIIYIRDLNKGYFSLRASPYVDGEQFEWDKDYDKILANLKDTNIVDNIIKNVGDYEAIVEDEIVTINGIDIPHSTIKDIYERTLLPFKNISPRMDVTCSNDQEHKSLMALIYSFGFIYNDEQSFEDAHNTFRGYPSTVIYRSSKYIGGNHSCCGDEEFFFPKDAEKIINYLNDVANQPPRLTIGHYDVTVNEDSVIVGCQTVPFAKVKEIYDAILKKEA
jgi:hypothetical protein